MDFSIKKIIDPRVSIPVITLKDDCELILTESDPASHISKLIIKNIPDDSFAFTLDYNPTSDVDSRKFKKLSPYLCSSNNIGINKSCDLVIMTPKVTQEMPNLDVIVLDLKSSTTGERAKIQLENSILFIDYIINISDHFYGKEFKKIRFFKKLITTSVSKNTISVRQSSDEVKKLSVKVQPNKTSTILYPRLLS